VVFQEHAKREEKHGKNERADSTLPDERKRSYLVENKRKRACSLDTITDCRSAANERFPVDPKLEELSGD
jgi:hypothetical protein